MTKQTEYRSDIGQFLEEFDKKPEAHSESREQEESKYKRVHQLRDKAQPTSEKSKIWQDF